MIPDLMEILTSFDIQADILETTAPGHAQNLARAFARQGESELVVMGGDGTFAEVVNGIEGNSLQLGLISTGSGNDLARSLGLPLNDIRRAIEIIISGTPRSIDIGTAPGRRFVSSLGTGFVASVGKATKEPSRFSGPTLFFLSVCKALHQLEPIDVTLKLDEQELEISATAVIVQNTPFTGGGLMTAPEARLDDGYLDVVVLENVGKLELMWNLPRVYRGTHTTHPKFRVFKTKAVSVESRSKSPLLFDGDIAGALPLTCRVLPEAIKVICPVVE